MQTIRHGPTVAANKTCHIIRRRLPAAWYRKRRTVATGRRWRTAARSRRKVARVFRCMKIPLNATAGRFHPFTMGVWCFTVQRTAKNAAATGRRSRTLPATGTACHFRPTVATGTAWRRGFRRRLARHGQRLPLPMIRRRGGRRSGGEVAHGRGLPARRRGRGARSRKTSARRAQGRKPCRRSGTGQRWRLPARRRLRRAARWQTAARPEALHTVAASGQLARPTAARSRRGWPRPALQGRCKTRGEAQVLSQYPKRRRGV